MCRSFTPKRHRQLRVKARVGFKPATLRTKGAIFNETHICIQLLIQAISIAPLQFTTTQRRSRHSMDTASEFHAKAPVVKFDYTSIVETRYQVTYYSHYLMRSQIKSLRFAVCPRIVELTLVAPQATASEGLAQGPYVTARVGFEPTILRTKGAESTNETTRSVCESS